MYLPGAEPKQVTPSRALVKAGLQLEGEGKLLPPNLARVLLLSSWNLRTN